MEPLSDEVLRETVRFFSEHGTKAGAARAAKVNRFTFADRLKIAARRGMLGTRPVLPGFEIKQTSAQLSADGELQREWVQQRPEAGGEFVVPDGHTVKGVSALLDPEGRVRAQWVKTREEQATTADVIEAVKESLADCKGTAALYPPPTEADPQTFTVIPLVDWHVGLMAWARETGDNYDLRIARDVILKAMAKVVALSPPSEKCIVLGLGDMLHFDGYEPVTTRSNNQLDSDGRYPKVLRTAVEMIRATVDMCLRKFAAVDVRILPGNHDDRATVAMNVGFSLLYESNDRVTFDDSPSRFWWRREGKVLLGATHGDKTKMRDLPLVMAADNPRDWSKSTYRRIYTGHIHHESAVEEGGVLVTSMRSPVMKDAYHSFSKYRAGRSVYSDTYDIAGGMAASVKVNL